MLRVVVVRKVVQELRHYVVLYEVVERVRDLPEDEALVPRQVLDGRHVYLDAVAVRAHDDELGRGSHGRVEVHQQAERKPV